MLLGWCGLGVALELVPEGELDSDLMLSGSDPKVTVPGPDLVVEEPEPEVVLLPDFA